MPKPKAKDQKSPYSAPTIFFVLSFVHGKISITAAAESFSGGTVHIYLEDTSRADAPAEILTESAIENIAHNKGEAKKPTIMSFRLNFDERQINPQNIYSLRIWIDTDGGGKQSEQDLYSDEFYPVLTRGAGNFVEIRLGSSG